MRKVALAFGVVALVVVFGVSAIGQSQPYPVAGTEATLADAAKTNNFPLFDALYAQGGAEAAQYRALHSFWKWSMTDPVGGFYGDEMHAKLAGEYPDYAEYIADYGIIDANGRAFWPSAETRRFLLKHAADVTAPVIRVAEKAKAVKSTHRVAARFSAPSPKKTVVVLKHDATPNPAVIAPAPLRVVVQQQPPKPAPLPVPESNDRLARGFALIIAGILGVGMLTLLLRTPGETA
ncbi:MAG TPA: hypothetical protein VLU46_06285 [Thermoanaerobaculia bacterium]|nr:hypothetical protein [Thermoanaerobaculia bacterium]